jgi:Zn-dependent metalloprotease
MSLGVTAQAAKNDKAIEKLKQEVPGTSVTVNSATETATFVRIPPGQARKASGGSTADKNNSARAFVSKHAEAFGLRVGSSDLKHNRTEQDSLGQTHVRYSQEYGGVPVFGSALSVHFDEDDKLVAVSGMLVPGIDVSPAPTRSATDAGDTALNWVALNSDGENLAIRKSRLVIYREGLAKGVPGDNHLAYEVEVGNGGNVREFVFVDAHTGKYIDQITGITDALNRRAFDGAGANPGPNYPSNPFWIEGQSFPTGNVEADNMILASKETYDFFANAFGRDSFDGLGATMDAIFNRGGLMQCPNASWNGTFISFCPGLTTDDVTGHEWGHAYTQYTDDLIYAWQPGALNESYSDVVGETVDRINGRDDVLPNTPRTDGSCSAFTTLPPTVTVNSPAAIAGVKEAGSASFGPAIFNVTQDIVLADDGTGVSTDACEALTNAASVAGKIALLDRGTCAFTIKVKNAQDAGAVAAIVADNVPGPVTGMGGVDATIVIPSLRVTLETGNTLKGELAGGVNATLAQGAVGSDNSALWLMGEDSTAPGLVGALRDMWNPGCYGDPSKVTDSLYHCATSDGGGVHINSGIPNHAFALLVDGGNFNGYSINAIGLTKANHILFRAKTHYQGPATDFVAHADALEQSCADLTGSNLASLTDGSPSGEIVTAANCAEVTKAIAAVELRTLPNQCGFQPLLAKNPPPLCEAPTKSRKVLFQDSFEHGNSSLARWQRSFGGTTPDFTERYWELTSDLPDDRPGKAFFGPTPNIGTCAPGGDESAVLHLDSPEITLPSSLDNLRVAFDHWIATEFGWDGGNVKISVNDGPWALIDFTDFVYNSYNIFLIPPPDNTNPIAGEQAFSGSDGGSVDGSWGRSIIDLEGYAMPKDNIRLRFDIGNDGCTGTFGWYVDDVSVFQCR